MIKWSIIGLSALLATALVAVKAGWAGELTASAEGWPVLQIEYVVVSDRDIATVCRQVAAVAGCAMPKFSKGICTIFLSQQHHANFQVVSEELAHCRGRDHVGEHVLKDAWTAFKNSDGQ